MKTAILAVASVAMAIDSATACLMLFAQAAPADSPIGPAGWASAGTLGILTIWLFRRDYDREKNKSDDYKTNAETIRILNETHAKALKDKDDSVARLIKEKDDAMIAERKAMGEFYSKEIAALQSNQVAVTDQYTKAYYATLERSFKHCQKHLDRHFKYTNGDDDEEDGK